MLCLAWSPGSREKGSPLKTLASSAGGRARRAPAAPASAAETLAYWYLRHHGYVMIARNFMVPGIKGEIDMVGYDGPVLAFVEVKTRTGEPRRLRLAGRRGDPDKRRLVSRMARQFLLERHIREAQCRFDVVAIESKPGRRPIVRLHKGAFADR